MDGGFCTFSCSLCTRAHSVPSLSCSGFIYIDGEKVPVSEEIYYAYKRPAWTEFKRNKVRADKERSLDRFLDDGFDIPDEQALVDEIVSDKQTNYNLVIEYEYNGMQTAAIFSGDGLPEVNSEIMKRRTAFLKKNPTPALATVAEQPADAAAEIAKYKALLDGGAITQEEYDAKKKQLLGL